jgi:hypothetical protein
VEPENIYGGLAAIDVPILGNDSTVGELQCVVQELVAQVNVANKALATAGYIIAERSREAMQQSKIGSDMATEALLKAYEVAAVAASSSRQLWKMCGQMAGPDMPPRTKDGERKPETTGRNLASTLLGVQLRQEEVAISHFRGPTSNEFILKFTRTGTGSSHEDLLRASKAMGMKRELKVFAKIPHADVDQEIYFLLRCMVKSGEAENSYTARSGRPAAWLIDNGESSPYSFGTVMEVRALMGPAARKEEARRIEEAKATRRKRALNREAVGASLKESVREMGMMEDIVRDEACEKGIVKGGGIRKKDKAVVSIFRGIKLDSVPAWANYGRGRGRGRGGASVSARGDGRGARGGQGIRGARGRGRGRGGARGGNSRGARGSGRGRGSSQSLTRSNAVVADTDRKRKSDEEDTDEAKKVKLMEMASPHSAASASSVPYSSSRPSTSKPSSFPSTASTSAASSQERKKEGKSLIGILMSGKDLDVGKGFRLFD